MRLYDSVVVLHDHSSDLSADVSAIRAALEAFSLRVHLYHLVQKRDALEVLAGAMAEAEYVILCCHGGRDPDGGPQISLKVIDQVDGDYGKSGGWESVTVGLTPTNIPDHFHGNGRTLISIACGSGQEAFAQAFLEAGYKAYIAPGGSGVDVNAAVLFVIGFFYHLMAAIRLDNQPFHHTAQEAVALAAQADADFTDGSRHSSGNCYDHAPPQRTPLLPRRRQRHHEPWAWLVRRQLL